MNAADQRRLTPWLGIVCVLLALLLLALLSGWGGAVQWAASTPAQPLPTAAGSAVPTAAAPPLQHYAEIWQRPLFTTNRQPAPETAGDAAAVSLGDLQLTGIILAPHLHMALLRDRNDGHEVRVREGAQLADGSWTLKSLKPRSAVFVGDGKRTELPLKVAPEIAGGNANATSRTHNPSAPMVRRAGRPPSPRVPPAAGSSAQPTLHATPATASSAAARASRIDALKARIQERRRQQSANAEE